MKEILDLFSGAGGAACGYANAGFTLTGVDILTRVSYPYRFVQDDALEYLRAIVTSGEVQRYALIHASPPCQEACTLTRGTNASQGWGNEHQQYIPQLRELLEKVAIPYVIEQPNGNAPIRKDITLCGEMFGLGVIRHRNFELGYWQAKQPFHWPHRGRVRGWRHGIFYDGPYVAAYGAGGQKATVFEMQEAMEINWTNDRSELTEAIPPAYTKWIGENFLEWETKWE